MTTAHRAAGASRSAQACYTGAMSPRTPTLALALWLALLLGGGCSDEGVAADAAVDGLAPVVDLGPREGGGGVSIDFVATGCAAGDGQRCAGPAPLRVQLALVVSGMPLTAGRWSFGDGTEASGASVSHTYQKPGRYTVSVSLTTPAGTQSESKVDYVEVLAVAAGGACASDVVCQSGSCVCAAGGCPSPLEGGLCLAPCGQNACPDGETCVHLGLTGDAPWRVDACYPSCTSDAQCSRPGFRCRWAPSDLGWQRACLPPQPADIGAPCRRSDGSLDQTACLGGRCLGLGAGGYCSASCEPGACPEGTRCAELRPDGAATPQRLCLRRCVPGGCALDPWLGCQAPGGAGALGFTIIGPADPAGTMYCAARACLGDGDCGLGGRCAAELGGYCAAP
jgi:PKD repeat protein